MLSVLKNRQGISYVIVCVIVLIVIMIILISSQYIFIFNTVDRQKNDIQLLMDSYLTKYSVQEYDALKQGATYGSHLDREKLLQGSREHFNNYVDNMEENYIVGMPTISLITNKCIGINVSYSVRIPLQFMGKTITHITVPISITSKLNEK